MSVGYNNQSIKPQQVHKYYLSSKKLKEDRKNLAQHSKIYSSKLLL